MNKVIEALIRIISNIFNKQQNNNINNKQEAPKPIEQKKEIKKIGLTEEDYNLAAKTLNCDVEAIKAFAKVESRGSGFLTDGRPTILFERHIFNKFLKQKGIQCNDTSICSARTGGYLGGSKEHERLNKAVLIDRESALQSASWGMFQVMAFNWKLCGYTSLQDFINAAHRSEADHLNMFVGFIKANRTLLEAVRNKNWDIAARIYNGPGYKKNSYDVKLARAYDEELSRGTT